MEQVMQMRVLVERNLDVKYFLPMDENPIHIRQRGKKNSPLALFPQPKNKNDRSHRHREMITYPKRTVKIGIRRVVGGSCQFVEKTMGQKSHYSRQAETNPAGFDSAKSFLNDGPGQDMRWLLHEICGRQLTTVNKIRQNKIQTGNMHNGDMVRISLYRAAQFFCL